MAVEPGYYLLSSKDPPLRVLARAGDGRPVRSGGYGGWTEVPRPRKAPITDYTGRAAMRLTLPLIFDGLSDGKDQRPFLYSLDAIAREDYSNSDQPPVVKVEGHQLFIRSGERWVIEEVAWDSDGAIIELDGRILRQSVTVTLMEFIEDVRLKALGAANEARRKKTNAKSKSSPVRSYTVKKGDTLSGIAAAKLGKSTRWREIATLNKIRDPKTIRPGQTLKLP